MRWPAGLGSSSPQRGGLTDTTAQVIRTLGGGRRLEITPLQRPAELAGRELLTAEEVANLQREVVDHNAELLARPARRTKVTENLDIGEDGAPGYYNSFWLDEGTTSTGRTSTIVDRPTAEYRH